MKAPPIVIVGGGPAGMMAGYLFARAGVSTRVIEKHADFLRDFRGDTVHPSTLDIFDELVLLDGLLARPHDRVERMHAHVGGRRYAVADFAHLPGRGRFIAMMPQWDFLDFLAGEARRLPSFTLNMDVEAVGLAERDGRVFGVRTAEGAIVEARLVIVAAGRVSALRDALALPFRDLGAPIDIFWFALPKTSAPGNRTAFYADRGEMVVLIDRGDYWQCGRVIGKGEAERVRAAGLPAFRDAVAAVASPVAGAVATLKTWDQVKLLSVSLDRLERWHRPGLLAIGDAAHAMSPVGGVGINLAVQDAVAAANILAGPMAGGADPDPLLARVQARRMPMTRVTQALQRTAHNRVLGPALASRSPRPPLALRLLDEVPWLRRAPARLIGLGIRPEHVRSPRA